jgi:hypothetical protein
MTDDLLALIRDERDRAIDLLRRIEEEGLTLHEAQGDGPTRDVTKKRANRQRQIIERMERLLAACTREDALADQP